ncbi:MAG TPA: hypothetical protein VN948_22575 [Terriglobales bacterium]|nr:hypothetical protein [Terriglobales bacterium]
MTAKGWRKIALVAALGFGVPLAGSDLPSPHPSPRIDYAMAYVPFLHAVVMHGGWSSPRWVPMSEAWKWDGQRWSRWETSGAPMFAHHAMVFDSRRNVLVVCGRETPNRGSYQMWEYDGSKWLRKADIPIGASAQGDVKIAFDSPRNRIVLYAARTKGTTETWEYDGKTWQQIKSAHQPVRCDDGALLQYDEAQHRTVLVGEDRTGNGLLGWDGHEWGADRGAGTQTWLWDGTDWSQVKGQQPPKAVWGGIAFDGLHHQMVLLTTRMETWTLQREWLQLHPAASPTPAPNGFFAMAYDPIRKGIVFFGGESRQSELEKNWAYPDSTWMYDGRSWSTGPGETDHGGKR